jgi:hypothetical protein
VYDNHIQASRDVDGNYILFSYMDTDTSLLGGGPSLNNLPEMYVTGRVLTTGEIICRNSWSNQEPLISQQAYFPTIPAEFVVWPNGDFYLPVVVLDLATGNYIVEDPVQFFHLGPDVPFNDQFSHDPIDYIQRSGWLSPWGFCNTIGIPEPETAFPLSVRVGPNPTADAILMEVDLQEESPIEWQWLNVQGQWMGEREVAMGTVGENWIPMSLHTFPAGIYQLIVKAGHHQWVQPVAVQR